MSRRLHLLLVALLAGGLIAAGCGDDDDDGGGGSDEPAQTQEDTGGGTGAGGTGDVPENVDQAIEQCKQAVNAAPQLSAEVKDDLESICEDAGEGDEDAVREATKEVCVKIIEDQVPAGQARETALQSCEQAGEAP
jgi:hypothetical protein